MKVYTQGSFDVFHIGHVNFLRRSAKLGNLFVGVLSDKSYENYRGYKPVNSFKDRSRVVLACEYVTDVLETNHRNTRKDLEEVKPDFITIGTDWVAKDIYRQWGVSENYIRDRLFYVPYTKGVSSSQIKEGVISETN